MLLLADENLPARVVAGLRHGGHDVRWISEHQCGIADTAVADIAVAEGRIIITQDKDFGELAMKGALSRDLVVILLRFDPPLPGPILTALADLLPQVAGDSAAVWVTDGKRFRRRPFPG